MSDSERPTVCLSTTSNMRTREHTIPVLIKFLKPVFGFNSSHIAILGGHLHRQVISFSKLKHTCVCTFVSVCLFTILARFCWFEFGLKQLENYCFYCFRFLKGNISVMSSIDWLFFLLFYCFTVSSFNAISRSIYTVEIKADHNLVSISIPENITGDVAGNRNRASNILQVRHCKDLVSFLPVAICFWICRPWMNFFSHLGF